MSYHKVKIRDEQFGGRKSGRARFNAHLYPKRSMSNSSILLKAITLFAGMMLAYASIFYVPSLINFGKILGISNIETKHAVEEKAKGRRSFITYYADLMKIRRGYFRTGQEIHIDYAISPGNAIRFVIYQCKSPPIIEVFHCDKFVYHEIKPSNTRGYSDFVIKEPGFYYFDEFITDKSGQPSDMPFVAMWSRGSLSQSEPKLRLAKSR